MFTNKFDYLYVEPSSYCSLQCPRCPRTYNKDSYKLSHLNPKVFFTVSSSSSFRNTRCIEFGGNHGDPIFHPELNELIRVAKENCPDARIIIHTSGNRDPAWWESLMLTLDKKDSVLFSIDGLKETNHLYRKKSNWEWIDNALDICSGKVYLAWKFIVFKHNQHQISDVISYAKNKGVNEFILTKSSIFNGPWSTNGEDPLAPSKEWMAQAETSDDFIEPKCQKSSRHYLSADGFFSPCCWMDFSRNYSINIEKIISNNQSFDEIFINGNYAELKASWNHATPEICSKMCSHKKMNHNRSSHSQLTLLLKDEVEYIDRKIFEFSSNSKTHRQ